MLVIKNEYCQYSINIDENLVNEIYENSTIDEIEEVIRQLKDGELEVSTLIEDAYLNDVELHWNFIDNNSTYELEN
jgi:hypothetical protein